MRDRIHLHTSREIGGVLTAVEVTVRLCCRALVASGAVEATKHGHLGTVAARISAATRVPCEHATRRAR